MSHLESAMNALSTIADSANKAVQVNTNAKHNRNMLKLEMEREQIKLDRAVLSDKFQTTQKALTERMKAYFNEQTQNADYSSYQEDWDREYSSLMTVDNIRSLGGLTAEEAQRFIDERGNEIKLTGDNVVAVNKSASARTYLATSYNAFADMEAVNGLSLDESQKRLEQKYESLGGRAIDISGKSNPASESNRYNLAISKANYSGKQLIERAVSDSDYSLDDALNDFDKLYDKNMSWVGASEDAVNNAIYSNKAVLRNQMIEYYQQQNSISYQRAVSKAEKASTLLSQAKTDGVSVNENTFEKMLLKNLDTNSKNDNQVYLDSMLAVRKYNESLLPKETKEKEEDKLTPLLLEKTAKGENIEDFDALLAEAGISKDSDGYYEALNKAMTYESKIRSNEESRAKAIYATSENEIKSMIASGDYYGDAVAYGHSEIVSDEDLASGNINLSNSIAQGLWSISAGSDIEVPAVQTGYSAIVENIAERYGITDPDEKRILASYVNNAALEMNAADAQSSSLSSGSSDSSWTGADSMLYSCILDTNKYSSSDIRKMYDWYDMNGMLSADFKNKFTSSYFGDDGSKRDSVWMSRAKTDYDSFKQQLSVNTNNDTASKLLFMADKNGKLIYQLEQWEMANPNATEADRHKFIDDMIIAVSSQDASEQIQKIVDDTFRYASGRTDASPIDSMMSIEQAYKLTNGTYSYLLNTDAVTMAKEKLYSDSADSYKKDSLYNDILYSVSGGRYKTMQAMNKDDNLSGYEKQMYSNLTYINAAYAVMDVSMFKSAETVAKGAGGQYGISNKTGRNLHELHVSGVGNAVLDEQGFVYIAEGNDSVGIYYLDPNSEIYSRVRGSGNASIYPTDLKAGGTYSLTRAVQKEITTVDAGQWNKYAEGYNKEFAQNQGKKKSAPAPEAGSLEYYGKGGYSKENYLKKSESAEKSTDSEKVSYKYLTSEKKTTEYMARDPELYSILERLYQ